MKPTCHILAVLICLCSWSLSAQFDETDTIGFSVNLDDYVITAQYKPTHYKNALHKTEIIDKQTFENRGSTQLDNALQISPKIRMSYDPLLGTQLRLRGIGASNVAVLIDGVPIIGRSDGGLDLSQIPLNTIERIELIEGPVSTIYGNNAAGGVINLISKKSQLNPWSLNFTNQLESIGKINSQLNVGFNHKKLFVNIHGQYFNYRQFEDDSLRIRETVVTEDGQSYTRSKYPWNPKEQYGGGANLRYSWTDNHNLLLRLSKSTEFVSDLGPLKRKQFNPYAQDMFFSTNREDVALTYNNRLGSDFYLEAVAAYNEYSRTIDEKRYYFDTNEFDSLLQTSDKTTITAWYSKLNLAKTITENLDVNVGLNYTKETTEGQRLYDENSSNPDLPSFNEMAIYTQLKFKPFDELELSTNGRWNRHSVYADRFTPSIQAKWQINPKITLRTSYAQGYRSPSLKELFLEFIDINHFVLGNENLMPEISNDLQAVLTIDLNEATQLSLNSYKTEIKNRIDLIQYEPAKYQYDNIDSYDVYGFSADFSHRFKAFNYSNSISLGYWSVGIKEDSAPSHGRVFDMNHSLGYNFPSNAWGFNMNYRHQGSEPVYRLVNDVVVINNIKASNFLDFSINKSFFKQKLSSTLGIKNIFDQQSADTFTSNRDGNHTTQEARLLDQGRSYYLRLTYQL